MSRLSRQAKASRSLHFLALLCSLNFSLLSKRIYSIEIVNKYIAIAKTTSKANKRCLSLKYQLSKILIKSTNFVMHKVGAGEDCLFRSN